MEKIKNETKGYFLISTKTNNKLENKDMVEVILGKDILETKIEENENGETLENTGVSETRNVYKIYILRVNKCVDIRVYFELLQSGEFNANDFKEIEWNDLKKLLSSKVDDIIKILHINCNKVSNYIKEITKNEI